MIDHDALEPGTRLDGGRYEIIRRLGRGGMATVYLARHAEHSVHVALKILSREKAQSVDVKLRFQNEMRIAASLPAHPNIVRPFEIGQFPELGGRPYLAMEYAPGPTLSDLVIAKPLAPELACHIVGDIAEALAFLHRRGIIHRDVKPSNVIVSRDGDVREAKLLDFGYAFELSALGDTDADRLTRVEERPGTKHYMAPEQAQGELPTGQFDVYALAATLYEALVGNPPYHAHSPREVVLRKCDPTQPSFSIEGQRRDIPPSLVALVDSGLQRDPSERIRSALDFREGLARVLAEMTRSSTMGTAWRNPAQGAAAFQSVVPTPSPRRGVPAWAISLGVAVAVLLVVLGVGLWRMMVSNRVQDTTDPRPDATMSSHVTDSVGRPTAAAVGEPPEPAPSPEVEAPIEDEPPAQVEDHAAEPTPGPAEATEPGPKKPRSKKKPALAIDPPKEQRDPPKEPAASCEGVEEEAAGAERARRWSSLARLTGRRECWSNNNERVRLRVSALYRLGRYDECAALKGQSSLPEVLRTASLCEGKRDQESTP